MKLRIETLTTLLMLTVILLAGCAGCAQKNAQPDIQTPIDATPEKVEPPDLNAPKISNDERQRRVKLLVDRRDSMAAARVLIRESFYPEARPYLDKALEENPNDFETQLLWVKNVRLLVEDSHRTYLSKKIKVYRDLYKMNPEHPDVLYGFAQTIQDIYPEEAVEYAEKAYKLFPEKYSDSTLLAKCYYEAGVFNKALAAYESVYKRLEANKSGNAVPGGYNFNKRDFAMLTEYLPGILADNVSRERIEIQLKNLQAEKRLGLN